jgi:membrane protease YdiL (CAAX protease family)
MALCRIAIAFLSPRAMPVALLYLGALIAAEFLTVDVAPTAGLALYALLLLGLSLHGALTPDRPLQCLLVSLTLVPLIRLVGLSLPLAQVPLIYWYLLVGAPLYAAVVAICRTLGLGQEQLGLRLRRPLVQLAVTLSGVVLAYPCYYLLGPNLRLVTMDGWSWSWRALMLITCVGFLEELIYRGLMQWAAVKALGKWGLAYVAVLCAALHLGHGSGLNVLLALGAGLFFGWVVERTGSIVGVALAHGLANVLLFLVGPTLPLTAL